MIDRYKPAPAPAPEVVGYFNWRRTKRGGLAPEKILKVHRDMARNSPDHATQERYHFNLVKETPLDAELWPLSLAELATRFPANAQ